MGLDMYAYAKDESGEDEHLADWRKHNRLHGWMEELWEDKGRPNFEESTEDSMGSFNCIPVELTLTDLEQLEAVITDKSLPETGGFFFGIMTEYLKKRFKMIIITKKLICNSSKMLEMQSNKEKKFITIVGGKNK